MSKTILIVDDSAAVRQVIAITLKSAGYEIIEGVDGLDALTKLNGQKVGLIISDVRMPNMDGIAFVKEVKKLDAYKFTPVIMLTTETLESRMQEGLTSGVKTWMFKPFQPSQMLEAVYKLMS